MLNRMVSLILLNRFNGRNARERKPRKAEKVGIL